MKLYECLRDQLLVGIAPNWDVQDPKRRYFTVGEKSSKFLDEKFERYVRGLKKADKKQRIFAGLCRPVRKEYLSLFDEDPPVEVNERVLEGYLFQRGALYFLAAEKELSATHPDSKGLIVRTKMDGARKNRIGRSYPILGKPVPLVVGWGHVTDGIGSHGRYEDALWLLRPGDALYLRPSNGKNRVVFNQDGRFEHGDLREFEQYVLTSWAEEASEQAVQAQLIYYNELQRSIHYDIPFEKRFFQGRINLLRALRKDKKI